MSISRASLPYQSYALEDIDPPFDLSAVHVQQGGRVVMGSISGAPTLVSATPADNSGSVAVGANIVLTFSNTVIAGTGTIRIGDGYTQNYIDKSGHLMTRWVGSTDSHTFNVTDSQVTISGNTVTINLSNDLKAGLNYSVTMAPGVLKDLSNRPYSGLADSSKLNFTTDTGNQAQVSGSIHFEDSGVSSTDYITNSAAQTVHGTYSGTLGAGEHVEVSIDNGAHWYTANAASGSWNYSGFDPVAASSTMLARVVDASANPRSTVSQAFTFDNTAPAVSMASRSPQLLSADDSGSHSNDHLTNVESPRLRFVTSGLSGFAAGDILQIVDSNHGNVVVASRVLTAQDLSGSATGVDYFDRPTDSALSEGLHNLVLQVGDVAGNAATASATPLALTIDRSAPTLSSAAPVEGAGSVATDTTIVLTFNEDVDVSPQCSFTLSDGNLQTEQQLGVESGNVSVVGNTITITLSFALDVSSNYTLTLQGSPISDLAGNIGFQSGANMLHFSTTASGLPVPGSPSLTFTDSASATGNGSAATDSITNVRAVTVGDLAGGSTKWYYSIDAGSSWHQGSGSSFNLGSSDHTYAAGEIQVKQTNLAGASSSISSNASPLTLDLTAPDAHITPASSDFSSSGGSQTITGVYTFSGTDESLVEVSFDNGSHWTQATTGTISAGVNSWSVTDSPTGPIVVRISDTAGNTNGIVGFSDKGVFLGSTDNDSFSSGAGSVQFGQDGDDTFTLNSVAFGLLAGGDGSDTAALAVDHQTLSLSSISAHLLGIDKIALGSGLHNTLAISNAALVASVADLASTEYTLTITGDATDTLDLDGSDFLLNTNADNSVYLHYDSGHQHLLVGVAVNIINEMTA